MIVSKLTHHTVKHIYGTTYARGPWHVCDKVNFTPAASSDMSRSCLGVSPPFHLTLSKAIG